MEEVATKDTFEIENPAEQAGCLVSIFKYITLWILGFFLAWVVLMRLHIGVTHEYAGIISVLVSLAVAGYLLNKALNQSDKIYKIEFDDALKTITFHVGNVFDGNNTVETVYYNSFRTSKVIKPISSVSPKLMGAQSDKLSQNRVLNLYYQDRKMNTIDIDLTPWCRHERIDALLEKFDKISAFSKAL